jgi:hypothetical protein
MPRILTAIALLMVALAATGCATCQSCQDYAPEAYGGICGEGTCGGGRVGSIIMPGDGVILSAAQPQAAPLGESEIPPLEPVPAAAPAERDTLGPSEAF